MTGLPLKPPPANEESAAGYMLRLLAANGASLRELRANRSVTSSDLSSQLASLAGVAPEWFRHRLPTALISDGWLEVEIFGMRWREPWLLRGTRHQVCAACLSERGFASRAWDLIAYPACHIHHVVLQDRCIRCGGAIRDDRPALAVCSCGAVLGYADAESVPAAPDVVAWCARMASALELEFHCASADPFGFERWFGGTSPDGAYRLVLAFAGGDQAFRHALIASQRSWLPSSAAHDLIHRGLDGLRRTTPRPSSERQAIVDALAEQQLAGITHWDRAIAGKELSRLALRPRRRLDGSRAASQLSLFDPERP
ncbi:TniQ family protein [Roseateles amylovorans]|uniref:TniQ family protein n=1 Tax=Roseateles amylovorans TaxID=2978473 RepID=UPI0033904877